MQLMNTIQQHLSSTRAMCQMACSLGADLNIQNLLSGMGASQSNDSFAKEMASNSMLAKIKIDFWDDVFSKLKTDMTPAMAFLNQQESGYLETLKNALHAHFPIMAFKSGETSALLTMDYTEQIPSFAVHKLESNGGLNASMTKIYDFNSAMYILNEVKRVALTK